MATWPAPPPPQPWAVPPGWWTPPPPPPQQRARPVLAVFIMLLLLTVIASAFVVPKLILDPPTGAVETAIADITAELDNGDEVAGTGMLINANGTILTNNHVIADATTIHVQIDGRGTIYPATVQGVDIDDDVAVLTIANVSGLPTVPIGNSDGVKKGDRVAAIGNAMGRGGKPTVTDGRVIAVNQTVTPTDDNGDNPETLTGTIAFDADIQPGDSGGALVDSSGKVIGMNTAGSASLGRFFRGNQGFAIPINSAMSIARDILSGHPSARISTGKRGIMGVGVDDTADGVAVMEVKPGSPAARAGIRGGDTITAINGHHVTSVQQMTSVMRGLKPGETVSVTWRDAYDFSRTARVTLAAGPLE